jgi:hypothetical protein
VFLPLDPANKALLMRVGGILAIGLFISLTVPAPARPPFLAGLYMFPSLIAAGVAITRGQGLQVGRLTHWDEAAAFFLVSLLFETLSDEAAREALREATGSSAG